MKTLSFVLSLLLVHASFAFAQYPEVMVVPVSAEANGMGDIGASIPSSDAMATIANPAQLGMFSLSGIFNASSYVTQGPWRKAINNSWPDYSLYASAANVGVNLGKYFNLPMGCSIGIGYSNVYFDEGSPSWYSYNNKVLVYLGASPEWQRQQNYTIGVGFNWLVKLGLGYTFQNVNAESGGYYDSTSGIYSLPGKTSAHSFGVLLQIPVENIASRIANRQIVLLPDLQPIFDINLGYARRNIGDAWVQFGGNSYSGVVPRSATLGLNLKLGLRTTVRDKEWNLFSVTLAREAEEVLIDFNRFSQNPFSANYMSGLGEIEPFNNLVLGRENGYVDVRSGWQVQFGELIYVRGGSDGGGWTYIINGAYHTFGVGAASSGLIKLLGFFHIVNFQKGPFAFVVDHLDLQYNYSRYSSTEDPAMNGTTFQAVNLVVR